jgi:preprotein translocase subunit SecF
MLNGLRDFTVKMVAGANVATVAFMLLVGYSDLLNPERFPAFCNAGLLFPVFLSLNLGFLIFWVIFRARYVLIPLLGFLVSFVPVRQYMPVNMKGDAPKGSIKVLSYNTWGFGNQTEDEDGVNICLSYLLEQNADIVCLQEAQPTGRNAEQIDSLLKPIYAYQDVTVHPHGGNALMLLSKYPILSKELIPYESQGNMSVAYRLKINDKPVLLINNHLETTGLSKEDRQQFKKLVVGPTLGAQSIQMGIISFVVAFVLLMVYMVMMYNIIPGMMANLALLVNVFFTLGILTSFQAALTLPGLAGMVLSLGTAVDANVWQTRMTNRRYLRESVRRLHKLQFLCFAFLFYCY